MKRQSALDGGALSGHAGVIGASAAAGDSRWREAGERRGNSAGGGGVSDAHFADGEQCTSFGDGLSRKFDA
jgi:hypothetical protein